MWYKVRDLPNLYLNKNGNWEIKVSTFMLFQFLLSFPKQNNFVKSQNWTLTRGGPQDKVEGGGGGEGGKGAKLTGTYLSRLREEWKEEEEHRFTS